jgi:hypothetical protein
MTLRLNAWEVNRITSITSSFLTVVKFLWTQIERITMS